MGSRRGGQPGARTHILRRQSVIDGRYRVDAVAEALGRLDPRYVPAGDEVTAGQVPVLLVRVSAA